MGGGKGLCDGVMDVVLSLFLAAIWRFCASFCRFMKKRTIKKLYLLLEVQQNVLYLHREKMKRMKNLTVKTEIKRKKTMDKNLIGTNAGIVWRAMTGEHSWSFEELKEHTELSDTELWTAIGWLARENQIEFDSSSDELRIYLNRSYF